MSKIVFYIINLVLLGSFFTSHGQTLEENNSVLFIKANVLFDSDRFDESVRLYNRILKDDPYFARALFMRGKAKYALGAFKGTKKDMLEYIDQRGITPELVEIMANTEMNLDNDRSALSYLELLHLLQPYEGKYFAKAAQLKYDNGERNRACEYWIKSAKLGDAEGGKQATLKCAYDESIHLPSRPDATHNNQSGDTTYDNETYDARDHTMEVEINEPSDQMGRDSSITLDEPKVIDVSVNTVPSQPHVDMNASQKIEVDDELTIILNSGLGEREVDKVPSILMLSDKSGRVALDVCINGNGEVISAKLNSARSSIFRSSLSSLAIRKAKEFVFMPSLADEQCGLFIYSIDTDK